MLRDVAGAARHSAAREAPAAHACVSLHASCVRFAGVGVVLLGCSGSGKSDLALRLIDAGGRLVADDRLSVERNGAVLIGRPAAALAGLIEIRGVGILRVEHEPSSPLGLVCELHPAGVFERLPEPRSYRLLGVDLPYMRIDPNTASAPAKIKLALEAERVA